MPSDGVYTLAILNTSDNTVTSDVRVNDVSPNAVTNSDPIPLIAEGDNMPVE
ncbi:hypothetical protein RintRC_7667 [Richelia intracellularis]|nr:hypothetical protein RintRC_7667 [Richelia intracellularis]